MAATPDPGELEAPRLTGASISDWFDGVWLPATTRREKRLNVGTYLGHELVLEIYVF